MSLPSSSSSTSFSTTLSASSHSLTSAKGVDDDKSAGGSPSAIEGVENTPGPSAEDSGCPDTKNELDECSNEADEGEDETSAEESEVLILNVTK